MKTAKKKTAKKKSAPDPRAAPSLLFMMANAVNEGNRFTRADLGIAHAMVPAILHAVDTDGVENRGSTTIETAVKAITEGFLEWSRDDDPLHYWYEQVSEIRRALTAAGLDADDALSDLRNQAGMAGFYVGLAYAYRLLMTGGAR